MHQNTHTKIRSQYWNCVRTTWIYLYYNAKKKKIGQYTMGLRLKWNRNKYDILVMATSAIWCVMFLHLYTYVGCSSISDDISVILCTCMSSKGRSNSARTRETWLAHKGYVEMRFRYLLFPWGGRYPAPQNYITYTSFKYWRCNWIDLYNYWNGVYEKYFVCLNM